MKVKSQSEVSQLCPTLSDPMDCSLPGSSIHGIFQARVLEWGARFLRATLFLLFLIAWLGPQVGATIPAKGDQKAHFTDEETEVPKDYLRPIQLVCGKEGTARPIFKLQDTYSPPHLSCSPPGARPAPSNPTKGPQHIKGLSQPCQLLLSSAELSRVLAMPSPALQTSLVLPGRQRLLTS